MDIGIASPLRVTSRGIEMIEMIHGRFLRCVAERQGYPSTL
jgi:hypothetical protein